MDQIGCIGPRTLIESIKWKLFSKTIHGYANRVLSRMYEASVIGSKEFHYWNDFSARSLGRPGHDPKRSV